MGTLGHVVCSGPTPKLIPNLPGPGRKEERGPPPDIPPHSLDPISSLGSLPIHCGGLNPSCRMSPVSADPGAVCGEWRWGARGGRARSATSAVVPPYPNAHRALHKSPACQGPLDSPSQPLHTPRAWTWATLAQPGGSSTALCRSGRGRTVHPTPVQLPHQTAEDKALIQRGAQFCGTSPSGPPWNEPPPLRVLVLPS